MSFDKKIIDGKEIYERKTPKNYGYIFETLSASDLFKILKDKGILTDEDLL